MAGRFSTVIFVAAVTLAFPLFPGLGAVATATCGTGSEPLEPAVTEFTLDDVMCSQRTYVASIEEGASLSLELIDKSAPERMVIVRVMHALPGGADDSRTFQAALLASGMHFTAPFSSKEWQVSFELHRAGSRQVEPVEITVHADYLENSGTAWFVDASNVEFSFAISTADVFMDMALIGQRPTNDASALYVKGHTRQERASGTEVQIPIEHYMTWSSVESGEILASPMDEVWQEVSDVDGGREITLTGHMIRSSLNAAQFRLLVPEGFWFYLSISVPPTHVEHSMANGEEPRFLVSDSDCKNCTPAPGAMLIPGDEIQFDIGESSIGFIHAPSNFWGDSEIRLRSDNGSLAHRELPCACYRISDLAPGHWKLEVKNGYGLAHQSDWVFGIVSGS